MSFNNKRKKKKGKKFSVTSKGSRATVTKKVAKNF